MAQPDIDHARATAWQALCEVAGWHQAAQMLSLDHGPSHELGRRIIAAALANGHAAQGPLVLAAITTVDPSGHAFPLPSSHRGQLAGSRAVSALIRTHHGQT